MERRVMKFRAWNHTCCRMDYQDGKTPTWVGDVLTDSHGYTPMQFTGLHDKNGKEIYEGDIDSSLLVVTYCGDEQEGLGMQAGWYLQRDNFESWTPLDSRHNDNGDNWDIIGNVYENPDLVPER